MFPEHIASRSQDLEEAIHDVGQFYWGKADIWLTNSKIFSNRSKPIAIARIDAQDIDTIDDIKIVEKLL